MTDEQIIRLYGKRCAEYCPECCVCEVWAMHDLIETQAREIERLREALQEIIAYSQKHIDDTDAYTMSRHKIQASRAALAGDSHD